MLLEGIFSRRNKFVLLFLVLLLYMTNYWIENDRQSWINPYHSSGQVELDLNYSAQACPIPKLEMYPESVKKFLQKNKRTFYNCDEKYALLFNSTLEGEIVPAKGMEEFANRKIRECCYQVIERKHRGDSGFKMQKQCHPLFLHNATKIPAGHQFILIKCLKGNRKGSVLKNGQIMDMHPFVHVKPEVERRLKKANKTMKIEGRKKVNVVILGLDAVSRMNFLRTMPKSYDFLVNTLKGVDMAGYNKVAGNTFPNIMPMLTSLNTKEVESGCGKNKTYDNCPFIWKRYADQGYVTSFAEDAPNISICNSEKKGFINQPTDYYLRPFVVAAESTIAHYVQVSGPNLCIGPRLGFQVLLENIKKFVFQMSRRNRPFFQFTWATSLTHEYLHAPAMGDRHLLSSLEWMKEAGHLNNTVFILMSDHGLRVGKFRNTLQGQMEDRLPIMILVLPEWMRKGKYATAYRNLVRNRGRLVTTFDLHETLRDILNLKQIENDLIISRAHNLSEYAHPEKNITKSKKLFLPRGISLFLPIPSERTCVHAEIGPNYCSCTYFERIDVGSRQAKKTTSVAIARINSIVKPFEQCAPLLLKNVTMAQRGGNGLREQEFYMVNFNTIPGNGLFEALVEVVNNTRWEVRGTISRTNLCRNQSYCVNDSVIKLYCFCKELGATTDKNN